MRSRLIFGFLVTLLILLALFGAFVYFKPFGLGKSAVVNAPIEPVPVSSQAAIPTPVDAMEEEVSRLREKVFTNLRADERLNLNMVPLLRTYRDMLLLLQKHAQKVETDIDILKEITKGSFQEDVVLQAALFRGKKPAIVAKHLEEFTAGRVGAILAKLKDKEASAILDVWAQPEDPRISKFYQQVMASYLNNKRRDANPEFFNALSEKAQQISQTTK